MTRDNYSFKKYQKELAKKKKREEKEQAKRAKKNLQVTTEPASVSSEGSAAVSENI